MSKKLMKFNVLNYKCHKKEEYDILPYFRDCWRHKYEKKAKSEIKSTKQQSLRIKKFKEWVLDKSRYMFWARCEYEFLMASWPFGNKQLYDDLKVWLPVYNIGDWEHDIKFCNIITRSMEKIDIHQQIMMNIDVIVDILYKEFKLDKIDDKRRVAASRSGDN